MEAENTNGLYDPPKPRPHKHVKYLALALYYWGTGSTQQDAIKSLRSAGFSGRIGKKSNRVLLYVFPKGCEDAYVDEFGSVHWYGADKNVDPPNPEKFWVLHDGTLVPYEPTT